LKRSDALGHTIIAVRSDERKAETLEILAGLRDQASAELARFREDVGVPASNSRLRHR
jgi:hypothetical protein